MLSKKTVIRVSEIAPIALIGPPDNLLEYCVERPGRRELPALHFDDTLASRAYPIPDQ